MPLGSSRRKWLSGLTVTVATIVSYFAFWHLAPVATFAVGAVALVVLIAAGWVLGSK